MEDEIRNIFGYGKQLQDPPWTKNPTLLMLAVGFEPTTFQSLSGGLTPRLNHSPLGHWGQLHYHCIKSCVIAIPSEVKTVMTSSGLLQSYSLIGIPLLIKRFQHLGVRKFREIFKVFFPGHYRHFQSALCWNSTEQSRVSLE